MRVVWLSFGLLALNGWAATPFIDLVSPPSAGVGWGPMSITIGGVGFAPSAKVSFGGVVLNPDTITPTQISVTIPYKSLQQEGTANIVVMNPAAGGNGVSNAVAFPVTNASPSVTGNTGAYPMSQPAGVVAGDFNGDGKLDLAATNWCLGMDSICSPSTINILLGNGAGNFTPGVSIPAGTYPRALATGDFNHDGKLDLVATGDDQIVSILLGDGAGNFRATYINLAGAVDVDAGSALAVADFNGDGNLDIVIAGQQGGPLVLFGDGTGNFTPGPAPSPAGAANSIAVGDFNHDGKLDLALAFFYSSNVTILLGDGAGHFTPSASIPVGRSSRWIAAGDFDGDGNLDLAVALLENNNLTVLRGDGTGNFSLASTPPAGNEPDSIAVADVNGDQNPDLVVAGQSGGVTVLLGDGTGSFSKAASFALAGSPQSVVVGDFDNDGSVDFAVATTRNVSVVLQNTPPPVKTLYSVTDLCAPVTCTATVLGDSGVVAGNGFAVYPGTGYVALPLTPAAVNKAGIIVGSVQTPGAATYAAAWLPQSSELVNLNAVFRWSSGVASYINNHGQIVGYTDATPVTGLIPGVSLSSVRALTDNGIVLGATMPFGAGGVEYAPGVGTFPVPQNYPFNSAGQIMPSNEPYLIFTPGSGNIVLPVPLGPFFVQDFNTRGMEVLTANPNPANGETGLFYTASGGLVPLQPLLMPGSGWTLSGAYKINNNGQILATGYKTGGSVSSQTSILLTPYAAPGATPVAATSARGRAVHFAEKRGSACGTLTFNSRPLCAGAGELAGARE